MKTVIKGAYYYDRDSDTILIPHFTGEYYIVDCSSYEQMSEIEDKYDQDYIDTVKGNSIEFEGKEYYSTEWSPYNVGDWELLSDIGELEYLEDDFDF